jgi:hypothetical protein
MGLLGWRVLLSVAQAQRCAARLLLLSRPLLPAAQLALWRLPQRANGQSGAWTKDQLWLLALQRRRLLPLPLCALRPLWMLETEAASQTLE